MPPAPTTKISAVDRLKLLRSLMSGGRGKKIAHAYIVPSVDAHQSEYLADCDRRLKFISNFSGSRGLAAITLEKAALWTDGRYFLQAQRELDEAEWTLMKEGLAGTPTLSDWLLKVLPAKSQVVVDPKLFTSGFYIDLQRNLKRGQHELLTDDENLIDVIWANQKPILPADPIKVFSLDRAGQKWQDKVDHVRQKMRDEKCGLLILSALDDIAWLFNLRGSTDIPFNPVFFAYCIVGMDSLKLFVDSGKVGRKVLEHLSSDKQKGEACQIHPYAQFYEQLSHDVAVFCANKSSDMDFSQIWVPGNSSNFAIYCRVFDETRRVEKLSPVQSLKAVKNKTEIFGMKNAQVKDAVAHCQFLHWLQQTVNRGDNVTEMEAGEKFEFFRMQQADYVGLSFDTISATGPNTAVIHYKPTHETDALIKSDELYLIDSGSQYLDGTTDITRTVCFKQPCAYQKECFTRVLKGHIALARLIMPENANGFQLDSIARLSLWDVGLDYMHGTGHGVGHFLCVHEGPAGFSIRASPFIEGFKENMIVTIEPGYYEDGKFGIRIENDYLIIPAQTKYKYADKRFLTFESISFVPIQQDLIDFTLLNSDEKKWLNDYHKKCLDTLVPLFQKQNDHNVVEWLRNECRTIP